MATWMLYSAGVAVLIACAANAADVLFRAVRIPLRWVWLSAMVATLLLSGVALLRMQAPAPVAERGNVLLPTPLDIATEDTRGTVALAFQFVAGLGRELRTFTTSGVERMYAMTRTLSGERVVTLLAGLWIAASIVLLLFFHSTLMRMARSRRSWREHSIDDISVLVSPAAGPALVGLVHPAIVVPVWLLAETPDRQRLVVQHEQEHLRAHDHAFIALACLIACLLPWNPALWWMLRRTRLAVELDCDARVLRRGAKAHSYGSLLLDIAGRTPSRPFGAPAIADSRSHLERRIIAMTEMARTPRLARSVAAGAAAMLLGLAACTADMPTAAEIDDLDVAEAQMQAEKLGFVMTSTEGGETLFYVDGVLVSEEEATSILAENIASIEVVKGEAAKRIYGDSGATGMVRMRTLAAKGQLDTAVLYKRRVPLTAADAAAASERESKVRMRVAEMAPTRAREKAPMRIGEESPLIILDGVTQPASFALNSLSPESIESVEVLKGTAARALYTDARAINGVILITTKKGGSR